MRDRWAEVMVVVSQLLLHQQIGNDPKVASELTFLDLSNLLGGLEHFGRNAAVDLVVDAAAGLESLLHNLGRPKALARASRIREAAAAQIQEWNHARFTAEDCAVDRLLEEGRFDDAVAAARAVLDRARAHGENAYAGAAYDLAMACFSFGRALGMVGDAGAALEPSREAQIRFQALADAGDSDAAMMSSAAITEIGDCLRHLGRLDEAAHSYEQAIERKRALGDLRGVAVNQGQLGTVRLLQRQYDEALASHETARKIFEQLGESRSVGVAWHMIGTALLRRRKYDEAEKAYQASLRIKIQTKDRSGESSTLGQLGVLYDAMDRLEEAVRFYQQALIIDRELNNVAGEGRMCNNLANTLLRLGRYDDARRQIVRALECGEQFGHVSERWKTFENLAKLEAVAGNTLASLDARKRAIDAYLAYRRDGGENLTGGRQVFEIVTQAIAGNQILEAEEWLNSLRGAGMPPYFVPLLPKLIAILRGARDAALFADPDLDYDDAAELQLLLEHLSGTHES
jgi:tetratricopeptide (TPR) repeat protein